MAKNYLTIWSPFNIFSVFNLTEDLYGVIFNSWACFFIYNITLSKIP